MTSEIANYLQTQSLIIENELQRLIPNYKEPQEALFEAARYALLGGGKRLRPILTLATTRTLQGNIHAALTPACTLELIHTYSLIHDDLPCMDDDDYRRGKLSLHRKYSEGLAVLTGDYLLTYAFEVLSQSPYLNPEKKLQLISVLSMRSGSEGMIGGQVMDIGCDGEAVSLETLKLLHQKKTGALIAAAMEFGGILSDATAEQMKALKHFGEAIGLAFQVVDDILDVISSEAKRGKGTASDIRNHKFTYVSLLGIEQAQAYASRCYDEAIKALSHLPCNTSLLAELAQFIIKRKY